MMSATTGQLLCESCGYPIDAGPPDAACPECGRPVALSNPSRRIGSPWQQRPALRSWLSTNLRTLRRPAAAWTTIRVETTRSAWLLATNLGVASAFATCAIIPAAGPTYIPMFFVGTLLLLAALASIEYNGIRFLGRWHRYRITPGVALAVIAHASVGLIVAGAGVALFAQAFRHIDRLRAFPFRETWANAATHLGIPFALGIIAFSALSGLGYQALRYANR